MQFQAVFNKKIQTLCIFTLEKVKVSSAEINTFLVWSVAGHMKPHFAVIFPTDSHTPQPHSIFTPLGHCTAQALCSTNAATW